jgi:hypothetical protein
MSVLEFRNDGTGRMKDGALALANGELGDI